MKRPGSLIQWGAVVLMAAVAAASTALPAFTVVNAVTPEPDCGPTREWSCVVPGCPDCPVVLFEGTVCEKAQFEKQTGRQCSPA